MIYSTTACIKELISQLISDVGDTHGISDTQVLEKQEQMQFWDTPTSDDELKEQEQPPPQHFVDAVKHAISEIEEQKRQSWATYFEEARKAQLQRRSKIIRQKNVICRTSPDCFCLCNLPLVVILGLPALFAYYFDPVNYLFTDSEYYSIPVPSVAKCCVFILMSVILIYCFHSRALIIEDKGYSYWFITVAWIIIYCVTIFFIMKGYTILSDTYFYDIPVPFFYIFYIGSLVPALGCCFCLFYTCFEHRY